LLDTTCTYNSNLHVSCPCNSVSYLGHSKNVRWWWWWSTANKQGCTEQPPLKISTYS